MANKAPAIELRKDTTSKFPSPGDRLIFVDGVQWGRIIAASHGMHGKSYMFQQLGGHIVGEEYGKLRSSSRKRHYRDNMFKPEAEHTKFVPTETLLMERVVKLIKNDRLRHPDAIAQEQKTQAEKRRNDQRFTADMEAQRFKEKASDALIAAGVKRPTEKALLAIVKIMRWAQVQ